MLYRKCRKMAENGEIWKKEKTALCKRSYAQGIHNVWKIKMCIKMWIMWITLKNSGNTGNCL